jgi:hypothetical protein
VITEGLGGLFKHRHGEGFAVGADGVRW